MPVAKVSPSMLSCDFAYLAAEAKRMEKNGADWLHLGKFTFL
jgi:ribulose-phosphate 3-epimerase